MLLDAIADNPNRIKNFVTTSTTDKAQMMSFFDLSDVSMDNENGSKEKEIKKTKEESYNKYNAKKHSKDDKDKDNFCSMDGKSLKVISIQWMSNCHNSAPFYAGARANQEVFENFHFSQQRRNERKKREGKAKRLREK